ncbi:MAG: DUF885 domain-containing protein, partial [Gammaproteobacteria bacterium]
RQQRKSLKALFERYEQTRLWQSKDLDEEARQSANLLRYEMLRRLNLMQFPEQWLPMNQMSGPQREMPAILRDMPRTDRSAYEHILARLSAMPAALDAYQKQMESGMKHGVQPPKPALIDLPRQIRALIPDDPWQSPLLEPFRSFPASIPPAEADKLRTRALRIFVTQVRPAWQRMFDFVQKEYLPKAPIDIAFSHLPNGKAWYQARVRWHTTLDLSPEAIHQIGLDEVARIRAEMEKIKTQVGFDGPLEAFFDFLRTNPKFFYKKEADLVAGYRAICQKIDRQLPRLFGRLPKLPYEIKVIPANEAKAQTTAYYSPGSIKLNRPGVYFVNTYALNTRPKWEMTALSLHEAVPGHHFQIALAEELENLPKFRRYAGYTAFVEGWALYAEQLGYDMGLYQDPYDQFGQLAYDMWRAIRLVVDTGMHSMGWSRQKAIDYFLANAPKTVHDVTVEVDRYLAWPGQALAYKIGQLKILELRQKARAQLGERFDIRAFHDEVLKHGAVPLAVLEANVMRWIADMKSDPNQVKANQANLQ